MVEGRASRAAACATPFVALSSINSALQKQLPPTSPIRPQVRHELERGHSVRYLLPDAVARYIYSHGLYHTSEARPRLLHLGQQKVDRDREA